MNTKLEKNQLLEMILSSIKETAPSTSHIDEQTNLRDVLADSLSVVEVMINLEGKLQEIGINVTVSDDLFKDTKNPMEVAEKLYPVILNAV